MKSTGFFRGSEIPNRIFWEINRIFPESDYPVVKFPPDIFVKTTGLFMFPIGYFIGPEF
jgi:hypothetical protein